MSWKIALVVALLSAVVTALATALVSYKVAGMHGMSDFEGKRAFTVLLLFVPLGLVGGFLLGLLGSKLVGVVEWTQFWKAAAWSIGLGQLALWSIAGMSVMGIPRAPLVQGQALAVEVEVLVPVEHLGPHSHEHGSIRVSLNAGDNDNRGATVDTAHYREEEGLFIVPAVTPLYSHSSRRSINFHLDELWLAFDLPLPPKPEPDSTWSTPAAMRDATTAGVNTLWSDVMLRYRVVVFEGELDQR